MNPPEYPHGQDLIWLAVDASGVVGAFITAGEGPIPASALPAAVGEPPLESQVLDLPTICLATLLVTVPIATSFMELAKRGLFVFDWSDVHRSAIQATGTYELVCVPSHPIAVGALPSPLQAAAQATTLGGASFATESRVQVHAGTQPLH